MFKYGQTDVHDEERSGRPSVVSDDFVQSVDKKICERRRFTISELSLEFPQISPTVLYEIITIKLGCYNFCVRWVPQMLTGAHKKQRMVSHLTFLERYHKDGDEFLSHILRVTGDETWVSFVSVETKQQSKQWMHIHQTSLKSLNKRLPARKLMETVFYDRISVLMAEFMLQGTTIISEVYRESLNKVQNADIQCTRSTPP
jgi:hypothetical protein